MLNFDAYGMWFQGVVMAAIAGLAIAPIVRFIVRRQTRRIAQLLAREEESSRRQHELLLAMEREIARKQDAESRLRDSEQKYRELFENNPHPMWVFDDETLRFLAVNQAAVRHYEYSRDEFLSMEITAIRPPEEVPELKEMLSARTPAAFHHMTRSGVIVSGTER